MSAMQVHQAHDPMIGYAITAVVILLIVALRWRRTRSARRLRLETMWILPAIYAAGAIAFLVTRPPSPGVWGWAALSLIVGVALGWQRGRMMRITVDPETHELSEQSSVAAFALLVGLLLVRQAARIEFGEGHATLVATDMGMAFGLGLIATTRLEMAIRARRLLGEARGAARST